MFTHRDEVVGSEVGNEKNCGIADVSDPDELRRERRLRKGNVNLGHVLFISLFEAG